MVFVTGAGNGLGQEYAHRLANAGARVAVVDVDGEAARSTAEEIGAEVGEDRVSNFELDVRDAAAIGAAVRHVTDAWGRLDALVNNAGGSLYPARPVDSFTDEQWTHIMEVNLKSVWLCTTAVLPVMRAAGYGKVVNVSSTTVARGEPRGLAPYIAAKAGVTGLTRALARELGGDGVRVNAIAPGYVALTGHRAHSPDAAQALQGRITSEQCLPFALSPADVAGAVEYLCSAASDSVTGQVFNVDGGWAHN
ncbi:SDR family NAD(P)-dependent oxidoreductase [Prauserella sp. PE36]|uniref:SDR family NAD(P)-dependent oxidoreductase n=1 Tax=Prauserella sp. PE36 TaxID=1504709 RepID=UPI001313DA95|nr:SDR family NAD(P)-dependent oxidoreductase [Prauserella sp. PE36]